MLPWAPKTCLGDAGAIPLLPAVLPCAPMQLRSPCLAGFGSFWSSAESPVVCLIPSKAVQPWPQPTSPLTGAPGRPPHLDPLTEASRILSLPPSCSAVAHCFSASVCPAVHGQPPKNSPTTFPWDVPLRFIMHQPRPFRFGGTGLGVRVLSGGLEQQEGAHTPAGAPGGSAGPAQGSDLDMAWGLRWHLCFPTPPAVLSSGSWRALCPQGWRVSGPSSTLPAHSGWGFAGSLELHSLKWGAGRKHETFSCTCMSFIHQ